MKMIRLRKINAPFRSCISKVNSTLIENAEDLDIVMPVYNLLEYGRNYSMTSESLWNYYKNEIDDVNIMLQMVNHLNIRQK